MGYIRKGMVINALREDMQDTKKCYEGYQEKESIEFCYNCMERVIDRLPQYYPENVVEETRWIPCSERQPEDEGYILVSFELEEVKPERTVREIREIRTPDPESEEEEGQLPGQMSDEDLSEVAEHMKAMMKILEKYRKE